MRYTTEVVNNIKVIKLNSWRDMFIDKIKSIRTKELFLIRLEIVVDSISGFLAWMISTNLILTTFLVFFLTGHEISLARAYAGIQVFKFLEYPLRWIPEFLSSLLDLAVSLKRIHKFLECSEINPALVNSHDNDIISTDKDIPYSTLSSPHLRLVPCEFGRILVDEIFFNKKNLWKIMH